MNGMNDTQDPMAIAGADGAATSADSLGPGGAGPSRAGGARYDLTLVVPCYNEADNLPEFFERACACFDGSGVSLELVFVNDGSKDNTASLLRRIVERERSLGSEGHAVQAISFSRNFGKEAALYAGMETARGACLGLIDADLQQTPEDALRMYRLLMDDPELDVVAACQQDRRESALLKIFKTAFYRTFNGVSDGVDIPADVSDFRVFRRSVADALLSLPECERFSKGLFAWVGFNTLQVPYEPSERAHGESKWSLRALFRYAASGIFGFTTWPLKIAVWLGAIASLAAVVYFIAVVAEYAIRGTDVPGYPTLACLILLFGGLQLFVLGIIGEYLARSYVEGKKRPIYIARERLSSEPDGGSEAERSRRR